MSGASSSTERVERLATAISETINATGMLAFYAQHLPVPREVLLKNYDVFFELTKDTSEVTRGAELIRVLREHLRPVRDALATWEGGEVPEQVEASAKAAVAALEPFGVGFDDTR